MNAKQTVGASHARAAKMNGHTLKATIVADEVLTSSISAKKRFAGTVVWVVTYGSTFFGVASLVEVAATAAAVYTTSQFLLFMIAFIGFMVAMILAITAANVAYGYAMEFDARRIKDRFTRWNDARKAKAHTQAIADMEDALRGGGL